MYSNYNELFELISEYESPTPLNDTCALILLLILGFVKNYSTVEELKADFEDLHICNEIISLELLIIFDQSIDYLLKSSIETYSRRYGDRRRFMSHFLDRRG